MEGKSPTSSSSHWAEIKVLAGLYSFLEALCLFQLLEAAHISYSQLPSIFKASSSGLSLSYNTSL